MLGYQAEALEDLGEITRAAATLGRLLLIDPADGRAAARRARLLRQLDRAPEALATAEEALAAGAQLAVLHFEHGMAAVAVGEEEVALTAFLEAGRLEPGRPESWFNAARLASSMGRPRQAADLLERTLRLTPGRADLWTTLGEIRERPLEDPAGALEAYRKALSFEVRARARSVLEAGIAALRGSRLER